MRSDLQVDREAPRSGGGMAIGYMAGSHLQFWFGHIPAGQATETTKAGGLCSARRQF